MRRRLEAGLVGLIGLACAAFAAVLIRGPAQEEERTMQGVWQALRSRWNEARPDEVRLLARDEVLRLPGWREGARVRVEAGMVVVTREGDPEDHVLQAGAQLRVPGRGLAVAWALEPSRVQVVRDGEEQPGRQPAGDARLSVAR